MRAVALDNLMDMRKDMEGHFDTKLKEETKKSQEEIKKVLAVLNPKILEVKTTITGQKAALEQ